MKYIIDSETHAKLSDEAKGEYIEQDGKFVLKLEGHEETFVPKAKRDIEVEHRKTAEKNLADTTARETKLIADLAAAGGSKVEMENIRKQHTVEVDRIKAEYAEKEKVTKGQAHKALISEEANKFAGEKFTTPSLMARAYGDRLTVEEVEGVPVIRVLTPDGKASVQSLGDLQKEFLENKEFAPIIKATEANGGGAKGGKGNGGAGTKRQITKAELEAMSQEERHQAFNKDGATMAEE